MTQAFKIGDCVRLKTGGILGIVTDSRSPPNDMGSDMRTPEYDDSVPGTVEHEYTLTLSGCGVIPDGEYIMRPVAEIEPLRTRDVMADEIDEDPDGE